MKILIFIVAFNAEKTIESVLKRIPASMAQYETEVLIIDDASTDRTWETAERFRRSDTFPFKLTVLVNPVNQGYGGNQKIGFLYAIKHGFDLVALVHGDGQYAPEFLPMLVQPIVDGGADAIFGSRMMTATGALKGGMPLYKYVGNRILTAFQNILLGSRLSEFHTGYRIYSTRALSAVPFQFNTNDFHFDTEIIIQMLLAKQRIKELPIPTYYGDEVCHVNGMKYAGDVVATTIIARLQSFSLMYRRNFDLDQSLPQFRAPEPKLTYDSTDSRVLSAIPAGSRVLDLGLGGAAICPALKAKGCTVVGVGKESGGLNSSSYDQLFPAELGSCALPVDLTKFDYVLMLDVIELQRWPERFAADLASATATRPQTRFIITAGNVGFFVTRLMLLFGQFNYGKRGILDLTHTRLFTFNSLRTLFESSGFKVLDAQGVPAPFPTALGATSLSRFLLGLNQMLIKVRRGLFSFEILLLAHAWPSLDYVLQETTSFSDSKSESLPAAADSSEKLAAPVGAP